MGTHCPALTRLGHLGDVHTLLRGHEAQHGEDNKARKEAGGAVDHSQDVGIPAGRVGWECCGDKGVHTKGTPRDAPRDMLGDTPGRRADTQPAQPYL